MRATRKRTKIIKVSDDLFRWLHDKYIGWKERGNEKNNKISFQSFANSYLNRLMYEEQKTEESLFSANGEVTSSSSAVTE